MMFSCSVWSTKGGIGKSTLSVDLASRLVLETSRPRTLLVDLDAQQSVRTWAAQAKQCGVTVPFDVAGTDARANEYDIVIYDHAPGLVDVSALKGHVVLMPVLPSFFDAASTIRGEAELRAKGKRVMLLPNRIETNYASDVAFLAGFVGRPFLKKRKAYQATIARGLSIYSDKTGIRGLKAARVEFDRAVDALIDVAAA